MSILGKRLREARTEAKLSQEKLGVLAGIDEMSASPRMNQYERGKHMPDPTMIERIANVLDLPVSYFYAKDDIEAELLRRFHRLKLANKRGVISFIDEVESKK